MSIFEDEQTWNKDRIINDFKSEINFLNILNDAFYSSNGEVFYDGTWYHIYDLRELSKLLN